MPNSFGASLIEQLRKEAKNQLPTSEQVDQQAFDLALSDEVPIPFAHSAGLAAQTKEDIEAQKRTIDQIQDPAALANMVPDEIVGQLLNPNATIQGTGDKIGNALAIRALPFLANLLPEDAGRLGGEFKQALGQRAVEHAQTLGLKTDERKQQQAFDLEQLGAETAAELPASEQQFLQQRFPTDIAQRLMKPSFLSPGDEAIGREVASSLSFRPFGKDTSVPFSPQQGLTPLGPQLRGEKPFAPGTEADFEQTKLTPAMVSSILTQRQTADTTQQASTAMVSVDDAQTILQTAAQAAGATEEEAVALSHKIQNPIPLSLMNRLTAEVGGGVRSTTTNQERSLRQEAQFAKEEKFIALRKEVSSELLNESKSLTLGNAQILKQQNFEYQKELQAGRIEGRLRIAETTAKTNFNHRLELQANELEDNQLNRDARYMQQVMRGEQAIDLETLRAGNRLALKETDAQGGSLDHGSLLEKYYLDFMKANPAAADGFVDILSNTPPGEIDLATNSALRKAMARRHDEIVNSRLVQDRLHTIVNTDIFAQTFDEKKSSLYLAIDQFGKMGMDTTAMQRQLTYMEAQKGSGQTINVNTGGIGGKPGLGDRKDIAFLRTSLQTLDYLGSIYDTSYTGFWDNIEATGKEFFGLLGERESAFRSGLQGLSSELTSAKTGAAIGPAEADRLLEAIALVQQADSKALSNMQETQRVMRSMLRERYSLLGITPQTRWQELKDQGFPSHVIDQRLVSEGLIPPMNQREAQ